jgi:hypothetical protein
MLTEKLRKLTPYLMAGAIALGGYACRNEDESWEKVIRSSKSSGFIAKEFYLPSVIQASDNEYLAAGFYWGSGRILKVNSKGNIEWNKDYASGTANKLFSIQPTSDGGYVAAGEIASEGTEIPGAWVLKVDRWGYVEWDKVFRKKKDGYHLSSIIQASDGGYFAVGYTRLNDVSEADAYLLARMGKFEKLNKRGSLDGWVWKLNSQGETEWDKAFRGKEDDMLISVVQNPAGDYVMVGKTASGGTGVSNPWLLSIDSKGKLLWEKVISSNAVGSARSIENTPEGGYIVAGFTEHQSIGGKDGLILKLNSEGNIKWKRRMGGNEDDKIYSIGLTSDGGFIAAGYTTSTFGYTGTRGVGKKDGWVIKLDSKGEIEWEKIFGRKRDDELFSIIQTSDKGYIASGYTKGDKASDAKGWILKLDAEGNLKHKDMGDTDTSKH